MIQLSHFVIINQTIIVPVHSQKDQDVRVEDIMRPILEHPTFREDYARLASVTLNPARHSAANARAHSDLVAERASALAALNHCSKEEAALLRDLGHAHDIGKI